VTSATPASPAGPAPAGPVEAELAPFGPLPDGLGSGGLLSPDLAPVPASFPGMIDALRVLQNRITGSLPSEELTAEVSRALTDLAIRLGAHAVDEEGQIAGRVDLPGRAQALVPVVHLSEQDEQHAVGRVTFGRLHLGRNGAVHGGAIPLVFDEVMGRLSNTGGRPPARTAYLRVNYRNITPIERELQLTARFDREEGRKRFLSGELRDGDTLCADVEGLFVALRPGQP
jgi:acyl-coenzyme A thioesterase PaaI-like protein